MFLERLPGDDRVCFVSGSRLNSLGWWLPGHQEIELEPSLGMIKPFISLHLTPDGPTFHFQLSLTGSAWFFHLPWPLADTMASKEICIVCQVEFSDDDFQSRRSTRYQAHCPKCSLGLRAILTASKGSEGSKDDESTSKYLQNLSKEDPEKYRKIFAEYESSTAGGKKLAGVTSASLSTPGRFLGLINVKVFFFNSGLAPATPLLFVYLKVSRFKFKTSSFNMFPSSIIHPRFFTRKRQRPPSDQNLALDG